MKKLLFLAILGLVAITARAQTPIPNLSYNALLNAACATPSAFCTNTANPFPNVPGGTGTTLDINSSNYAVATVTISGTYTGATVSFDFSDQTAGTNYFQVLCSRTDVNIIEAGEILPANQSRAWQCPLVATTRFRVRVSAIASGALNTWITVTQTAIDPSPTVANLPQPTSLNSSAFTTSVQSTVTASVNVKASAGNVYGLQALNGAASTCWVQFINSAGAGTLGTGVIFAIPLPASTTQPVAVGPGDIALANFSSGIAVGIATTANGAVACGTGGNLTIFYQ
jgi:hypothetical protein